VTHFHPPAWQRLGALMAAAAAATALAACAATPPGAQHAAAAPQASEATKPARPNILLILADDLGYADVGAFGGEIATPHIDRLAKGGATLTNFYASPFCSPTRAMLMSGTDNHLAGFGDMAELMLPEQRGKPGYEGYLSPRVAALPEVLKASGYRTVMAGKWHLGNAEEQSPAARGFDRSYAMTMGGASHFGDQFGIVATDPAKPPKALYRENGKPVDTPRQHFYSSEAFADRLLQYLDETRGDGRQPFFAYWPSPRRTGRCTPRTRTLRNMKAATSAATKPCRPSASSARRSWAWSPPIPASTRATRSGRPGTS
jgi:arylsulfatase